MYALLHRAPAADRSTVVVDGRVTATSVMVVGPGSDDTVATHIGLIVVGVFTAAAGVHAETPASQLARAADVVIGSINLRSAATRTRAVGLVQNIVGTTKMVS